MTEAKTASPLESAVHSITWFHQLGGEPSPSDHPLVRRTQSFLAHQTLKKEPITVSQLERVDELAKLVRSDVQIEDDLLKLFIQSSKTDLYKDGAWIVVASSRKATCPVDMMNRYLDRAGLSGCDSPLFCQLSKTKCGYKPRSKGLSY